LTQLVHRYADAVDNGNVDAFLDVFHPDGRLAMILAGETEPASIRNGHSELASTPTDLEGLYAVTVHQVSNHLVDVQDDLASGSLLCIARLVTVGERATELVHIARYTDQYERRDGVWRILHREVRVLWSMISDIVTDPDLIVSSTRK
jgi:3-phenylpropionate/cinnamic acid dioxygenase small subunit